MDMRYEVVDNYRRQAIYDFYADHPLPFYALTFELDVTAVKRLAEERERSFYLTCCYLFTRAACEIEAFRYRLVDGVWVRYQRLHARAIVPLDDGTYCFARLPCPDSLEAFERTAEPAVAEARRTRDLTPEPTHGNFIFYSALPGVPFTSLTHVPLSPEAGEPNVSFGQISRRSDRLVVPVGLQVNHRFIDGQPLGELVRETNRRFADPEHRNMP